MYTSFQIGLKYLGYYLTASNGRGHGMHSPFVYEFITRVLNNRNRYPAYTAVEKLRRQLLQDSRMLAVEDFGAGSAFNKKNKRSVKSIASKAAKSKKYGQLLFRMVQHYKPRTIIELGTSLGITTCYLSLASPQARVITMEGAQEIARTAKNNFSTVASGNIELVTGNFDDTLPQVMSELTAVDFAFIDGNHRQAPAERYFSQLLTKAGNNSIFIFDDIYWSSEMEAAWRTIKDHPDVRCTMDLFFIGIVLFRTEFKEKQHFRIRF